MTALLKIKPLKMAFARNFYQGFSDIPADKNKKEMIAIDTKKIEDIIRHVAATEVLPRFKNLKEFDIREKSPGDLVTIADEGSERALTKLLQEALPGSLVVGEEAVANDEAVLDRLKSGKPVWIIDPLDGTGNFARGSEKFGILVALVQNGVVQYGWAFDVVGNRMAVAKKGAGTALDGKPLKIDCKAADTTELTGRGGAPKTTPPLFKEMLNQYCALHDCMDFITGKADFVSYAPWTTPWDHAAATLLAEEAGGYVAMNKTAEPYDPSLYGPARLLIAPSKSLWNKIYAALNPKDFGAQPKAPKL